MEEVQSVVEEMAEGNYILVESKKDIHFFFGKKGYANELKGLFNKKSLFFAWKYSQLLKFTDDKEYRELLLESIEAQKEEQILGYIRKSGIMNHAMAIGEDGRVEITKKGQLRKLREDGTDYEWNKSEGGVGFHPELRQFDLFDLSLATIKKAMKELKIKVVTKDVLKKAKEKREEETKKKEELKKNLDK